MKMGSDWKSALDCPVFHENFAAALQPSSWTYFEAPGHFLSARGEAFNAQDMYRVPQKGFSWGCVNSPLRPEVGSRNLGQILCM